MSAVEKERRRNTRLCNSASLAMVVLSPPGIMSDETPWSCSGFLISTPFTPNLLSTESTQNQRDPSRGKQRILIQTLHITNRRKKNEERTQMDMPAMCSLKEPCKARTPIAMNPWDLVTRSEDQRRKRGECVKLLKKKRLSFSMAMAAVKFAVLLVATSYQPKWEPIVA